MVVDIETVLIPSATAILHLLPQSLSLSSQKTKAGAYTLGQLQSYLAQITGIRITAEQVYVITTN